MRFRCFVSLLFLLVFISSAYIRFVDAGRNCDSESIIKTVVLAAEEKEEACKETYGFMPCTNMALGNVFQILVYVSGLSGDASAAQSQIAVGMGSLAGSTVIVLTVIWGTCTVVGKCDLRDTIAINNQDTKRFHLKDSGVTVDVWTSYAARIMAISVIPFVIVQLPQMLDSTSGRHLSVLVALVMSVLMLISYCVFQVFQPLIQKRRLEYAKRKHFISGFLMHLKRLASGKLLDDKGQPHEPAIRKLFKTIDTNKDGYLSAAELKAFIIGISFEGIVFNNDDAVGSIIQDFDIITIDEQVDENEFVSGIKYWLLQAIEATGPSSRLLPRQTMIILENYHWQTRREHTLLGDNENGENEEILDPIWVSIKAALMLLLGAVIVASFANPLVDTVNNFSAATRIPSFFISFIVLPLATSSDAVSAIVFASRKRIRTASLTFSQLCGGVTMNNVLCLSVFLAIVYLRGLTWNFSSEVLVILIVCLVMGGFASFRTTYPLWTCFLAYLLYPFSLCLVYILDYKFGWS